MRQKCFQNLSYRVLFPFIFLLSFPCPFPPIPIHLASQLILWLPCVFPCSPREPGWLSHRSFFFLLLISFQLIFTACDLQKVRYYYLHIKDEEIESTERSGNVSKSTELVPALLMLKPVFSPKLYVELVRGLSLGTLTFCPRSHCS